MAWLKMYSQRSILAMLLVPSVSAALHPIVLDDADAVLSQGSMSCGAQASGGRNAGSFHHNGGTLPADVVTFAEYPFDPQQDGCYLLEEYHPAVQGDCGEFTPQSIPLKINFCKNLSTFGYIDQSANVGTWNKLITLPFYVGHPASIQITREGTVGPMSACQPGKCFWIADAFRLTYLAPDCQDPEVRQAMEADIDEETGHNHRRGDANTSTTAVQPSTTTAIPTIALSSQVANVSTKMVIEAVLQDAVAVDGDAVFTFQPPLDGCYVIEEMHPDTGGVGLDRASLTINYCKGLTAVGEVRHSDGRHNRWNYVATLPFFAGQQGSMVLPERTVFSDPHSGEKHAFRLTHVGGRCRAPEASVHQLTLRITADFAHVSDRLAEFEQGLVQSIADKVAIPQERISVNQIRSGSIVVEFTLRSALAVHGRWSSALVAQQIVESVSSSDLPSEICDLVSPSIQGCGVFVVSSKVAHPTVVTLTSADTENKLNAKTEVASSSGFKLVHIGVLIAAIVGSVGMCVLFGWLYHRRISKVQSSTVTLFRNDEEHGNVNKASKTEEPMSSSPVRDADLEITDLEKEIDKIDKDSLSDNASTITPESDNASKTASGAVVHHLD